MTGDEYNRLNRMFERVRRLKEDLDYALSDAYDELRLEGFDLGHGAMGDRLWLSIDDDGFILLNWVDRFNTKRYMREIYIGDCMSIYGRITPNGPWEEDES